ncbi:putative Lipase/lipooxygenase, PLAT/LH2 family protein [Quillaja saponaria]|uniref:Lipase/lipooxygenase, PLAT/LH2 family protein n=2 Tax=Quillaja saponaria TaxID=32244 RepID=A0AAD7PHL8_QUISA|nr:putative Lipase/lipooxygenase, PLAT/LH2 family protein [Quillaja saponaria]
MIDHTKESGDVVGTDMMLHFQKGSVNEFAFEGPKMGRVQALWISVDSGQWRLGSLCLTVINYERQPMLKEKDGLHKYIGFQYDFCVEDILLGEGSDTSMAELKPCLVTELSSIDPFAFFSKGLPDSTLYPNPMISNEQSMKEYADLKFSLLLYDGMLIFIGTSIAFFSAGESAGLDFLMGGIGGFLYLLLLQRSVDGLPPPESFATNTRENDQMFKAIKGPISTLAWVIGFALFAVKYNSGDLPVMLTPKDLIVGMMGFLACKVSVVLAAVKPLPLGLKSTK